MRKLIVGLPIAVVVILFVMMVTPFLATCGGADEAVTATLKKCERATKLIGSDAHPARLGLACGSTKISGSTGNSAWTMPFTGDTGRGTVSYRAVKQDDEWYVQAATLEVGDETIDLVACAGGRAAPATKVLAATFDGKVTSSTHEAVKVGMECKGTIDRTATQERAEAVVTCSEINAGEGVVVYRGSGTVQVDTRTPAKGDEWLQFDDRRGPVNAHVEFDGKVASLRVWSETPAWEIVADLSGP